MTNGFVEWVPEYTGHEPPRWQDGMEWHGGLNNGAGGPSWCKGSSYRVPLAAVEQFDPQAWLEQGRKHVDQLPEGVVLPPTPLDLWAESIHEALTTFRKRDGTSVSQDREDQIRYIMAECRPSGIREPSL